MDRHSVPQNIMEVEFKLFGAFTVKQFAYLAGGFVGALIIYFSILPFILKFFLIIFSILAGVFLSIVRINDQPSSVWVGNFIKAMGKSSKLVWKKRPITPEILKEENELSMTQSMAVLKKASAEPEHVANKTRMPLVKLAAENENTLDVLEQKRLGQIEEHFNFVIGKLNQSYTNVPKPKTTIPNKTSKPFVADAEPRIINRNEQNLAGEQALHSQTTSPVAMSDDVVVLHQPVDTAVETSEPAPISAVSEVAVPAEKVETTSGEDNATAEMGTEGSETAEASEPAKSAEPPSFTKSNIITGIVVDRDDKAVKDAVVIVKTSTEELVRKMLSNSKGFVTLTTPLPSGEYYIDIEAKGYKFDRYQVNVNDQVLPVFKFVAK